MTLHDILSGGKLKEYVKHDLFKSFVRYWAIELGEHYPSRKILFYSLSAVLTSLIFIFGFAGAFELRKYALQYDATMKHELLSHSTPSNGIIPTITGFSISSLFGLKFIKSWKKRVVIGIAADLLYLALFVGWTLYARTFFNYLYLN